MYEYNAKCIRIIDGDTIKARIDLGFHVWIEATLRLRDVDTPECRTRDLVEKRKGMAAKGRVAELMEDNNFEFVVISHGTGKYGRVVCDIKLTEGDMGDILVSGGPGERYED